MHLIRNSMVFFIRIDSTVFDSFSKKKKGENSMIENYRNCYLNFWYLHNGFVLDFLLKLYAVRWSIEPDNGSYVEYQTGIYSLFKEERLKSRINLELIRWWFIAFTFFFSFVLFMLYNALKRNVWVS